MKQEHRDQVIGNQQTKDKSQSEIEYSNVSYASFLRRLMQNPSTLEARTSSLLEIRNLFALLEISSHFNLKENQSSTGSSAEPLADINIAGG